MYTVSSSIYTQKLFFSNFVRTVGELRRCIARYSEFHFNFLGLGKLVIFKVNIFHKYFVFTQTKVRGVNVATISELWNSVGKRAKKYMYISS